MRVFFGLSPAFGSDATYRTNAEGLFKPFGYEAWVLSDAPDEGTGEWVAAKLADCQFAFFDITGFDPTVMFALGVAAECDTPTFCLIDKAQHAKLASKAPKSNVTEAVFKAATNEYVSLADFGRKAQLILTSHVNAEALRDARLVSTIKDHITRKGPIYMKQIAREVGRPMGEIQPVVYALVRAGQVQKVGETRWSQYRNPQ